MTAGSISSIPYLIASFSVPFLGSLSGMLGEAYFELMLFIAVGLILIVHIIYLTIADFAAADSDNWLTPVLPLIVFGFGHALFTTVQSPVVPKLVKNEAHLSRVFTYIKITESLAVTTFIYFAGYIRQ